MTKGEKAEAVTIQNISGTNGLIFTFLVLAGLSQAPQFRRDFRVLLKLGLKPLVTLIQAVSLML